jgi:hypothetical protein
LRKQAYAASQLEDKTPYIVPHGNPPAGDIRLYLENMLAQVAALRVHLKPSNQRADQWRALSQRFPELNDIVDRTHTEENITLLEMRHQLIRLFQSYVSEWDLVIPSLSEQLGRKENSSVVDHTSQLSIRKGLLSR